MRARDALGVIVIVCALLAVFEGRAVRKAGDEMTPGWERTLVLAVGKPAGWLADRLPLEDYAAALDLFRLGEGRKIQVLP